MQILHDHCFQQVRLSLHGHSLQMYDAKRFTDAGFRHYELYFPDGSCPPDTITAKFLDIAEREAGKHCTCAVELPMFFVSYFLCVRA